MVAAVGVGGGGGRRRHGERRGRRKQLPTGRRRHCWPEAHRANAAVASPTPLLPLWAQSHCGPEVPTNTLCEGAGAGFQQRLRHARVAVRERDVQRGHIPAVPEVEHAAALMRKKCAHVMTACTPAAPLRPTPTPLQATFWCGTALPYCSSPADFPYHADADKGAFSQSAR